MSTRRRSKKERGILWCLFLVYVAVMVYFLFFAESFGRGDPGINGQNLIPFHEIGRYLRYWRKIGIWLVILNLAGNIAAFVPFGFILPMLMQRKTRGGRVILAGFFTSCLVEFIQLVTDLGTCDVDDIILNTLGVIVGLICYEIAHGIRSWVER